MGIFRGGLLLIAVALLVTSLLFGNIFITISSSLSYENVEDTLNEVIFEFVELDSNLLNIMPEEYTSMNAACQNSSELLSSDYNLGFEFSVPCDVVLNGTNSVVEYGVNSLVTESYYKEYDCGFWSCLKDLNSPLFLVSKMAKDYWKSKFNFMLLISFGLLALIFLLVEKKQNFLTLSGIMIILASLPLLKIESLMEMFLKFMGIFSKLGVGGDISIKLFKLFFSNSQNIFAKNFTLGIILIVAGVGFSIWRLFRYGVDRKFSKTEVKDIVKQEIVKKEKENTLTKHKGDRIKQLENSISEAKNHLSKMISGKTSPKSESKNSSKKSK